MSSYFRILESKQIYQSQVLSLREERVQRGQGNVGTYATVKINNGVTVLAITKDRCAIIVRQMRYAADRQTIELIGGGIEEGESPQQAAVRELKEESGATAHQLISLGEVHPFTAIVRSTNYLFLALGVSIDDEQNCEDSEAITLDIVPYMKLHEMVMSGELTHAASCLAVFKSNELMKRGSISS